ncbi:hypothetical protein QAD02_024335 [Eretmocerus hayati]|uniref:Uncharacterized protein n=1 Tax=Eretmocerus hayati TaxID=131215 RepID=A0ACC2PY53_9HYME|nr:hypothetical protein QAD02_024335 [Eretmocerus hayati]
MGRTCCILTCRNYKCDYEDRVSMFKVPNDPVLFAKWSDAAMLADGSEIGPKSVMCERHFQENELRRETPIKDSDGNVILKRPLETTHLCKQAIPSIFHRDIQNPVDKRRKKIKSCKQDQPGDTNEAGSLMLTGEESFEIDCNNMVVTFDPNDTSALQLSLVPHQQPALAPIIVENSQNLENSPENLSTTDFLVNGSGSTFRNSHDNHSRNNQNGLTTSEEVTDTEQSVIPIILQTQVNESGDGCFMDVAENVQINDPSTNNTLTDVASDEPVEFTNTPNRPKILSVVNFERKKRITVTIPQEEMMILSENSNNDTAKGRKRRKQTNCELLPQSESQKLSMEFDLIYKNSHKIKLPNSMWGYHKNNDDENIIIFSKARWFKSDVTIPPLYEKQVIFHRRNGIKIYVNKKFSPVEASRPRNLAEMEMILRCVDDAKICQGGPNIAECVPVQCAMEDYAVNRWRHKLCPIVVRTGDDVCRFCSTISHDRILKYPVKKKPGRVSRKGPNKHPEYGHRSQGE